MLLSLSHTHFWSSALLALLVFWLTATICGSIRAMNRRLTLPEALADLSTIHYCLAYSAAFVAGLLLHLHMDGMLYFML